MNKTNRIISLLLIPILASCAGLQNFQNSPATQAAETAAISIGLSLATKSPTFSFVAPIAVSGLTSLVNGSNPTAVTGIVAQDAPLIISTVTAAIPNSAGKTAATAIANAYVNAMNGTPATATAPAVPALPATPAAANAVIAAIASGLTSAASSAPGASVKEIHHSIVQHRLKGAQRLVFAADNERPMVIQP